MRWKFLLSAFAVCAIMATGMSVNKAEAADKVYKWRAVSHQMVGTSRFVHTIVPFCEMVKAASGGRLIIEPYGAGVLFPVSETFDAVRDNMVQMAMCWSGYWGGKHPLFPLASGRPGGPITSFSECYYRSEQLAPIMERLYAKFGVTYLGSFDFNPSEILVSAKAIRSFDDFKGKNIRAGGLAGPFYSKIGVSVVLLTPPEIYQALQLGTVDGAEYNDWLVNKEMAFDEVAKYVIEPAVHTDAADDKDLIVNPDAWKELPDDLKAIVMACRDMARYKSAVAYGAGNDLAKQQWIDGGAEVIQLPAEDVARLRKAAAELLVDMAGKDPITKEYVDGYAKVLHDLGYIQEAADLGYTK